jgi:cytochrome c2
MLMLATVRRASGCAALVAGAMLIGGPAFAQGDATAGAALFADRCVACHSVKPTRKPGPVLARVYDRRAGTVPGYAYSAALKHAGLVWTARNLDRWLAGPPAFIPGVNMQAQVDSPVDRGNLIAYLKSISPAPAVNRRTSAAGG